MAEDQGTESDDSSVPPRLRLRALYHGASPQAAVFGYALLSFDTAMIWFFIVESFLERPSWLIHVYIAIAIPLAIDYGLRVWVASKPVRHVLSPVALADLVVIFSLLIPAAVESLAFLRMMRSLRLLRSYHVLGLAKRQFEWVRRNEDVIVSALHLTVFIFIVTSVVYVTQSRINPAIGNYVDALYFTIATLTTTGFGDITLEGGGGKVIAVAIMIFGISLFIRLAQTIFRPAKVRHRCETCGLLRHEHDAVHCKHCGSTLDIPNDGEAI